MRTVILRNLLGQEVTSTEMTISERALYGDHFSSPNENFERGYGGVPDSWPGKPAPEWGVTIFPDSHVVEVSAGCHIMAGEMVGFDLSGRATTFPSSVGLFAGVAIAGAAEGHLVKVVLNRTPGQCTG